MATPPVRTALADTYPNPSNAVFRTGIGAFWDYATGLLGSTGNQKEARALLGIAPAGQCRLTKSGANLLLSRYQGSFLTVNDVNCLIPSAGVTLAATGLTVGATYYIYATAAAGVVTALEASTTGHSTDTTTGVEIKTGDPTRTLVGMARPVAGPNWVDTGNRRFVVSWFNRRSISCNGTSAATGAINTGTPTEVPNGPRAEFLAWPDEVISATVNGMVTVDVSPRIAYTYLSLDAATQGIGAGYQAWSASSQGSISNQATFFASEGYHYIGVYGQVTAGSSTWNTGVTVAGVIRG